MKSIILSAFLSCMLAFVATGCDERTAGDDSSGDGKQPPVVIDPNLTNDFGVEINGVKWATRNVNAPGMFTPKFGDVGMHYQWNRLTGWRTEPLTSSDGNSAWDSTNAAGTDWEAATDPCPEGWRVFSQQEALLLIDPDNVSRTWTPATADSPAGFTFTDKSTKKSLFLPAGGVIENGELTYSHEGFYWSSTGFNVAGHEYSGEAAHPLAFSESGVDPVTTSVAFRNFGMQLRCVAKKPAE